FVTNPGSPPLPIFLGLAIPLSLFLAAYFGWTPFRDFILGADLRFVAAMQSWRWAGQFFFWLYAWRVLPGLFAFPAGIGDMATGATAPWLVLGLCRACFAWTVCFPGRNRRHGNRGHGEMDSASSGSQPLILRQSTICDMEYSWNC